jgi:hypothetical protein
LVSFDDDDDDSSADTRTKTKTRRRRLRLRELIGALRARSCGWKEREKERAGVWDGFKDWEEEAERAA